MADRWFKVPYAGGQLDTFADYDLDGYTGVVDQQGNPPWVVRVYADAAVLDALASDTSAGELSDEKAAERLNNTEVLGRDDASVEEWEEVFRIGAGQ